MRYTLVLIPIIAVFALACGGGGEKAQPPATSTVEATATAEALAPPPTVVPRVGHLAYVDADGELWLVSADGAQRKRLVPTVCSLSVDLHWSPRGDRLVCQSEYDAILHSPVYRLVDTEGNLLRELYGGSALRWAPTGTDMLIGDRGSAGGILADANGQLLEQNLPGLGVWSPDGASIAYVNDRQELVVRDLETAVKRTLANGISRALAWVSNGDAILVAMNERDCAVVCLYDAVLVDVDTGEVTRVSALDQAAAEGCPRQYWLSPDGARVAFLAAGDCGLSLLDFSTLLQTPIQGAVLSYPSEGVPEAQVAFSPDGAWLYWASVASGSDAATIYRARADGSELSELGTVPGIRVWFSGDATKVAYLTRGEVVPTLWVSNLDGGGGVEIGSATDVVAWQPHQ
jgi:Tol biopolymer transport system component